MARTAISYRLPDIPDAGYETRRARETTDAIMIFLRAVERDRVLLLSIVIDGKDKFRHHALKQWRGLLVNDDIANSMWEWLALNAGANPVAQRDAILRMQGFGNG